MSSGSASHPVRFERWRLFVLYAVIFLAFSALFFRLISLQVMQGSQWTVSAVDNYTNEVSVPAPRGIIYDRNGYILARNLASYNIVITPVNLPNDSSDIQRVYRELSELIKVPVGGRVDDENLLKEAKLFGPCVPGPGITQLVALQDSDCAVQSCENKM